VDATTLLGSVQSRVDRPYVVLKYAQTLDGRIATGGGDSKWISGVKERRVAHAMRAACDAVLVGAGTVLADDPLLTVRMVPGASPIRVILDSTLRVPSHAQVFGPTAATLVLASERSSPQRRAALRRRGVKVEVVREAPEGIDLADGLARLLALGIQSVLVEGGGRVITSTLRERLADRVVVAVAPLLLGTGTEAVGDLGTSVVADGLRLLNRTVHQVGPDLLVAGDLDADRRRRG
jgi:riboflavin-specific deaminase-like protein